jgi:sugar phosphate isomerase/epimerase
MQFTVQDVLVPGETLEAKWGFAAPLGFAGLELWGKPDFAARLPELRAAAKAGVPMRSVCVIADCFIGDFDPDRRAAAMAHMTSLITTCAEIGGKGVITPAAYGLHSNYLPPFSAPRDRAGDNAVLIDALGQLGDHARAQGIEVWFEPLNRYEDHMCNTLADGVAICRALNHGSVKLMADLFHMSIEEADMSQALREAGGLVAHVHLADSNRREPGKGHTDFAAAFAALKAIGFAGDAAMECILSKPAEAALPEAILALNAALTH